jgi:hypothetical protein
MVAVPGSILKRSNHSNLGPEATPQRTDSTELSKALENAAIHA